MTDDHTLYETDAEWIAAWERWAEAQEWRRFAEQDIIWRIGQQVMKTPKTPEIDQ